MPVENRNIFGEVHRDAPTSTSENSWGAVRASQYGELGVQNFSKGTVALGDDGTYFVATNPTPGTGIAGIAAADGNNDLENLVSVYHGGSNTRIYIDYLTLRLTAAGTNGTDLAFVHKVDAADRYTSGGSAITEVNPNMDSSNGTDARIHFGALVSPAATSQRLLGGGVLRVVIGVVGDIYRFDFGGNQSGSGSQGIINATAPVDMYTACCPVVIGPGDSWLFQTNASSQSGAISWEFELGFWER